MSRIFAPRMAAVLAGLGLWGGVQAAAIGTGLFDASPHILGKVRAGEFEEVQRDFAKGFGGKPLSVRLDVQSDQLEVARIGLWLKARQPEIRLRGGICTFSCSFHVLPGAGRLHVDPGTVIALTLLDEWPLLLKDRIDAGDLFVDNDDGRASRERLLQRFASTFEGAERLRALRRDSALPAAAMAFVDRLTRVRKFDKLNFAEKDMEVSFSSTCMYWVPDQEGLKQLGLDVPGYQPPPKAEIAKALHVPEHFFYLGPMLSEETPLPPCGNPASPPRDGQPT